MGRSRRAKRPSQQPFSLLVKPAGADCNIACTYCFYLKKQGLYPDRNVHRMSDEVLERLISGYLATDQPVYSFGWQGGEPTLMGVDFFRKVTEFQQKHGRPGVQIANGLQTNTTMITEELAAHLAEFQFLVGASLDGPPDVHNAYRLTRSGKTTHHLVLSSIDRLRAAGVAVNVLVLVSQANVRRAGEVYTYLRSLGFDFMQFIPCVEFTPAGEQAPFSITGKEWGEFLSEIFDQWYPTDVRKISIRHHDSLMQFLLDGARTMCTMGGRCDSYYVVEHTGDVYPCDFYVDPNLRLGNIAESDWGTMERGPIRSKFAGAKSQWNPVCTECKHLAYCSGDCVKHRAHSATDEGSWLCEGWRAFYDKSIPTLRTLAESVHAERGLAGPLWDPNATDPEEPCYCGSGKKYRNCHGRVRNSTAASATS